MITYNDIYEAARKERYSEQIQPIAKNFVKEVSNYLAEKREAVVGEDNIFSDIVNKTKKQVENAQIIFKELMLLRRKKILNLVLIAAETGIAKKDFENMFAFEKELFESLMKCVEVADKKLIEGLKGKQLTVEKTNILIVFVEDVDSFMDLEGNSVGPFEKGQIANMPKPIAKILIDSKKAEYAEE